MPIRIRESHIRTTVGDIQRQSETSGEQNDMSSGLSNEVVNQIAEKVMIQVERKLKGKQER